MKLLLVCTSGGHFATMRGLQGFWANHERVWVTDRNGDTASLEESESVRWLPFQAPRDIKALIKNLPDSYQIIQEEKPDLILSTGASVAINFAIMSRLTNTRFTYIESISRFNDLSISGKIIYPLCTQFYVQWPELCQKYSKATFAGYVS